MRKDLRRANPAWKENPYFPFHKPKYQTQPTRTIRVPVELKDNIERYAYAIDQQRLVTDTVDQLMDILDKVQAGDTGYKSNSASKLIKDLKALIP